MKNQGVICLLVISFCSVFLFSCSKENKEQNKKIFFYNESANISSLDPAFAKDQAMIWADCQIYNGLLQLDSSLNVEPCIAKSFDISKDKKTYTFHLRSDVFFHDSPLFKGKKRRVVANDFVYSFNRIVDSMVASPGAWVFDKIEKEGNKYSFTAINDTTLEIRLKEPFSPFLQLLTMPYCYVVPKEVVDYYKDDFRKHPIGTGAFQFKYWKEGVKLVLVKNKNYFEKDSLGHSLPYLDAVDISFIVDKQSVFLEFIKGNIDFISGIDPNYKDEILTRKGTLQPKYQNKINLTTQPYLNTEYLGFYLDTKNQNKNNPLLNKDIRQAINYGFDRKKMIKYLRNNIGKAGIYGIIPKGLGGYSENGEQYSYNPQKAHDLLVKGGYFSTKKPITITLSTTSAYLDLCKYIQQQLILLGMDVKVDVNPPGALREQIAQGKSPFFRGSWIADYADAENYLSLFYSKNFAPKGPNYTHFSNKRFDILYEQASKETSNEKRYDLYKQMNDIIIKEAPIVVLYYDQVLRFTQKNISGLHSNAMNLLILKTVKKN